MKVYGSLTAIAVLVGLGGCGSGDDHRPPPQVVTHIVSDPVYDGDIEETGPGAYVVTQGMSSNVQTVFAGIPDPSTGGGEFRTFLDFPLGGPDGVPRDASIDNAFLEVRVIDVDPLNGSVPIRVDLVALQRLDLVGSDFDRSVQPPLASVLVQGDITHADAGQFVSVDVTPLMVRAQQLQLPEFQVRVMEDLGPAIYTLAQIDDSTYPDRSKAPLLTVTYH